MTKIISTGALLAALVSTVAGHTSVEKFTAGGKTYDGFRQESKIDPKNNSPAWFTNQGWGYQPVFGDKINHPDIIAHKDASPSPNTVDVPAGSPVTFQWFHQGTCGNGEVGWDCSHHGWTATWLAPCNGDCKNVDKTKLSFFKIHQSAMIDYRQGSRYAKGRAEEQPGYWGTDAIFYDGQNKQTVTIPKGIPSGNYVLRTEVASIHNNGPVSERQFWPQAFNIRVTGGNDQAAMPAGKKATEIYSNNDELLKFDLYWHTPNKIIKDAPGGPVASFGGATRRHAKDFA